MPETEEWTAAHREKDQQVPGIADLFRGEIRRTTLLTITGLLAGDDGPLGVHVLVHAPGWPVDRATTAESADEICGRGNRTTCLDGRNLAEPNPTFDRRNLARAVPRRSPQSKAMHRITPVVAAILLLLTTPQAHAKARYKGVAEMIETAEAIAVVEVASVHRVSIKGEHWTYGQEASAKVEKVLKGKLPGHVLLHGDENFDCARCLFEPGRFLVFLKRDGSLLAGNNWHLSARRINGDEVEWFTDVDKPFFEKKVMRPLSDVLKEVETKAAKKRHG